MSRQWTRFSFRSLLLVVALAGVYFGFNARSLQREKEASADLRHLGGQLELSQNESTALTWLRGDIGRVKGVHYLGPNVGDENIETIVEAASKLPKLDNLTFMETRISGAGEHALKSKLPNLDIKVITPVLAPREIRRW